MHVYLTGQDETWLVPFSSIFGRETVLIAGVSGEPKTRRTSQAIGQAFKPIIWI